MMNLDDAYDFFGTVELPAGCKASKKHMAALAHIAWKGGIYEDCYNVTFRKWFRQMAEKFPTHFKVKVFDVYPIDEFRWTGPYSG